MPQYSSKMKHPHKYQSFTRYCKIFFGILCALAIGSAMLQVVGRTGSDCPVVTVLPAKPPDTNSIPLWTLEPVGQTEAPPKILQVAGDRLDYEYDKSLYPKVAPRKSNRTLYMYPYTGLCNTLQSVASAFTVADREGFDVKLVLDPVIFGPAAWIELFEEPKLDIVNTTFPDGVLNSQQTKACEVHEPIFQWREFKTDWEIGPDGSQIRCVSVCCWREDPFPLSSDWFYRSLVPAQSVREAISSFKDSVEWHKYQWIGVHLRRSDNMDVMRNLLRIGPLHDKVDYKSKVDDEILSLSSYIDKMNAIAHSLPEHDLMNYREVKPIRFFLATDNSDARDFVVSSFPEGMVTGFKKEDYNRIRSSISGMQSSVVDLFLLAGCEVLIGTPYSTFSATAKYIGKNFYVEPDFVYKSR